MSEGGGGVALGGGQRAPHEPRVGVGLASLRVSALGSEASAGHGPMLSVPPPSSWTFGPGTREVSVPLLPAREEWIHGPAAELGQGVPRGPTQEAAGSDRGGGGQQPGGCEWTEVPRACRAGQRPCQASPPAPPLHSGFKCILVIISLIGAKAACIPLRRPRTALLPRGGPSSAQSTGQGVRGVGSKLQTTPETPSPGPPPSGAPRALRVQGLPGPGPLLPRPGANGS